MIGEGGRATASRNIGENVILSGKLVDIHMKWRHFHQVTIDTDGTINCVAEDGLLSKEQVSCKQSMTFPPSDGLACYWKRCKSFGSIRVNSLFADSRLTLSKILRLMYWWSEMNCQLSVVKDQANIALARCSKLGELFSWYIWYVWHRSSHSTRCKW